MKKKILLIITFMMVIFLPSVKAEDNMKVIFNTSFEEQIDINKIEKIFIMMDDVNLKDYEIVLERKDNFSLALDNLPQGDVIINSITVGGDYTVNYDYEYTINTSSQTETIIQVLVTKVIKDENREKVEVSNEYIANILGYDPLKMTTTKSSTTSTTISKGDDEPIIIGSTQSTTSTVTTKNENTTNEEEKKKEQEKRKSIYLMILLIFIAVIIILGGIMGVKIAKANK